MGRTDVVPQYLYQYPVQLLRRHQLLVDGVSDLLRPDHHQCARLLQAVGKSDACDDHVGDVMCI